MERSPPARTNSWHLSAIPQGIHKMRYPLLGIAASCLALDALFVADLGWNWDLLKRPVTTVSLHFGGAIGVGTVVGGVLAADREINDREHKRALVRWAFEKVRSSKGEAIEGIQTQEADQYNKDRWHGWSRFPMRQFNTASSTIQLWFGLDPLQSAGLEETMKSYSGERDLNSTVSREMASRVLAAEGWEIPQSGSEVRSTALMIATEIVAASKYLEDLEWALEALPPEEISRRVPHRHWPRLGIEDSETAEAAAVNLLREGRPNLVNRVSMRSARALWDIYPSILQPKEHDGVAYDYRQWMASRPFIPSYSYSSSSLKEELPLEKAIALLREHGFATLQCSATSSGQAPSFSLGSIAVAKEILETGERDEQQLRQSLAPRLTEDALDLIPEALDLLRNTNYLE